MPRHHVVILALAFVAGSCGHPPAVNQGPSAEPRGLQVRSGVVGHSVEGRQIRWEVYGDGPDVCMIIATIHGNEAAGTPLLASLKAHLDDHPDLLEGRSLVLVPVANPDGLAKGRRHNVNGVDLNRNFPADNFQASRRHGPRALSEPEARALRDLVYRHNPARVVSIHQPIACIDWDGPGEGLARAMSELSGLEARRIGSRPGSFGSWIGVDMNRPIITVELPRSADRLSEEAAWDAYGSMLIQSLIWPRRLQVVPYAQDQETAP